MNDPKQILLVVAIICELGAAGIGLWQPENRFNLMALGLFFFFLTILIH
jgi:hypothetical protein